jgi:Peptidase C10 family/Carboxypeptidase regulatory-like domain/Spi protease inhibitor
MSATEAERAVAGWLTDNAAPLDAPLGRQTADVESIANSEGRIICHIVRIEPSGFVIVAANDLVEPIIGFAAEASYDPSPNNPLLALLTGDLSKRLAAASSNAVGMRTLGVQPASEASEKWHYLLGRADAGPSQLRALGIETVADVRVPSFIRTHWSQSEVCEKLCYNYYTPENYYCGCVATAMAQLMYYHRYPKEGIGRRGFMVGVNGWLRSLFTRGGDGSGGPYLWNAMAPTPRCSTSSIQRQAIGAICHDAGISVGTSYHSDGSGANAYASAEAITDVFGYANAICIANDDGINTSLTNMINPNLDAKYPIILGITGDGGHAVIVDGYGYDAVADSNTLYHHMNMGWAGQYDMWYNLPDILGFDAVTACIYNVYVAGEGEIISGRVTDALGQPIKGALVSATTEEQAPYLATTNSRGIYALTHVPSLTTFSIAVEKTGHAFRPQSVYTGASRDYQIHSGNKWGIDFTGVAVGDADDDGDVDFYDFAALVCHWGTTRGATPEASDAVVDFHMLTAFLDQWLLGITLDEPIPVED